MANKANGNSREQNMNEMIERAIAEKHIVVDETATVEISDKASPTGKGAKTQYRKLVAQDAQGMAAMCGGKIVPATPKPEEGKDERTEEQKAAGACDYFNYGYDLEVRAKIRTDLMGTLEGPEKQITKLVAGLKAAGFDADAIRTTVLGSPKFQGTDGLANLIDRALKAA